MGSLESGTPERVGEGGRRTLEEPWAASAHSDETFAAPFAGSTQTPEQFQPRLPRRHESHESHESHCVI